MTTLARWTPLRDAFRLHNEMNRLFDFGLPTYGAEGENLATGWAPPVDIYEDTEGLTMRAEIPGFNPGDIDLNIENNTLTLKGERKLEKEDKKENYHRVERFYGTFSRSFSLPSTVDTEKVRADSKNGVLTIFLPRREETKPRQIQVKVEN